MPRVSSRRDYYGGGPKPKNNELDGLIAYCLVIFPLLCVTGFVVLLMSGGSLVKLLVTPSLHPE